jgi:hypothetical protein
MPSTSLESSNELIFADASDSIISETRFTNQDDASNKRSKSPSVKLVPLKPPPMLYSDDEDADEDDEADDHESSRRELLKRKSSPERYTANWQHNSREREVRC